MTKSQAFAIRRNPAVPNVTDADLVEQFRLAQQINEKVSVANGTVVRIRSLKDQIADRLGKTSNAALKKAGETLSGQLTDIEGEIYQHRNRSSQDPLNFPIRLNNKLAALQGIVESGDYKPTDQSVAVFKELSGRPGQSGRTTRGAGEVGARGVQQATRGGAARANQGCGCRVSLHRHLHDPERFFSSHEQFVRVLELLARMMIGGPIRPLVHRESDVEDFVVRGKHDVRNRIEACTERDRAGMKRERVGDGGAARPGDTDRRSRRRCCTSNATDKAADEQRLHGILRRRSSARAAARRGQEARRCASRTS